jgi:hypothetical protein
MLPAAAPANAVIYAQGYVALKDFVRDGFKFKYSYITKQFNFSFFKILTGFIVKCVAFAVLFLASNTYLELLFPWPAPSTFLETETTMSNMTSVTDFMTTVVSTLAAANATISEELCSTAC